MEFLKKRDKNLVLNSNMATAKGLKALEKKIEILERELAIVKELPTQLVETLTRKRKFAEGNFRKFADDMIADATYINRLNAAMERQKIKDYTEVLGLIVELAEELPELEE